VKDTALQVNGDFRRLKWARDFYTSLYVTKAWHISWHDTNYSNGWIIQMSNVFYKSLNKAIKWVSAKEQIIHTICIRPC